MKKQKEANPISNEQIDEFLKQGRTAQDINAVLKQLTKAIVERAMQGEMTHHLGYSKHDPAGHNSGNSRNGVTSKTLKGEFGEFELETPRDRNGEFHPQIIQKNQTRWTGFDDKILSMYTRGMTTREIQGHLEEIYGVEISPSLISEVTDAVWDEVQSWQSRPLESLYPIVYLDALYVKNSRRWARSKPSDLRGHRSQPEGEQRGVGTVDRRGRRGQVLAAGAYGTEESRCGRCVHRLC